MVIDFFFVLYSFIVYFYFYFSEHIFADKSSGRLSAPPPLSMSSFDGYNNYESSGYNTDLTDSKSPFYTSRTRGAGLTRSVQPAFPLKGVSAAQQYQYDIRPDGTVVRMRCPTCGAEKFRSMLGFLNHCRIHCKLSFANQDDRLQRCGVVASPEEIPAEYQNLSHSLVQQSLELAQICADVLPTKVVETSRPEISVCIEDPINMPDFKLHGTSKIAPSKIEFSDEGRIQSHSKPPSFAFSSLATNQSRYYFKKQLIIGNVSRCLLNSKEIDVSVGGRSATHFFKLYIRDISFRNRSKSSLSGDEITRYIKFVRFFLHPAYKPNDIVDVYERPFTLERPAWGEFPTRIQIHFFDEKNKPIDLIHILSIFSSVSSRYDEAVERLHEIDIDRRTDFSLSCPLESVDQNINIPDQFDSASEDSDSDSDSCKLSSSSESSKIDLVVSHDTVAFVDSKSFKYCRYCGVPHMPQKSFEIIQKNCAHRPRKIRLSSRTAPTELFSGCTIHETEVQFSLDDGKRKHDNVPNLTDIVTVHDKSKVFVKLVAANIQALNLFKFHLDEDPTIAIAAAVKCFLKNLISKSLDYVPNQNSKAALDQNLPSVLTPLHIFQAITSDSLSPTRRSNLFDFLSNAYFSASLNQSQNQSKQN